MEPIRLYESLFFFYKCNQVLQDQREQLHLAVDAKIKLGRTQLLITNYIIMESVSFIDEFEQNFHFRTEQEFKEKVILVRKLCNPIFKRIKRWEDIKEWRNNTIAHPWRDKDKNFTIPDINKFNVPRNWFEHVVLADLLNYVYKIIENIFSKEFMPMLRYMATLIPPEKKKASYENLTSDLVKMALEVDAAARSENYEYNMQIIEYTF